jgi:hypothetical protein
LGPKEDFRLAAAAARDGRLKSGCAWLLLLRALAPQAQDAQKNKPDLNPSTNQKAQADSTPRSIE